MEPRASPRNPSSFTTFPTDVMTWVLDNSRTVSGGRGFMCFPSFSLLEDVPDKYLLASFYTKYDTAHFVVNTVSLLSVLIPKLPQLHGVRIFGINKY
ncbi:hypothetical protein CRUP_025024 [Coryphaenoides rupestris]|nr:hypothetical protein CRUP_025024 [Coryphaenoides rupestris]